MSASLRALPNLGPESVRALMACGIETADDLRGLGAAMAYRIVGFRFQSFTHPLFLYALHGALDGRPWASDSAEERAAQRDDAAGVLRADPATDA